MPTMLVTKEVCARLRRGKTALYEDIAKGVVPPFVKLGPRRAVLPEHEVDAILTARTAGLTEPQLIDLVGKLVEQRSARFQALMQQ